MSIRLANGTVVSKATLLGLMTDVTPNENKVYRFDGTATYFEGVTYDGETAFEGHRNKAFIPNQLYRLDDINAFYPAPTFVSLVPGAATLTTLPAAGGTAFTVNGTDLTGTTSVTFGGTAATSVVVVNNTKVTGVTPAKTAGTYPVVIVNAANPTLSGGNVTYV